ncbi:MAG: hypothetical protein ACI4SG_07625 [Oligosphaeraceae bacterium]
MGHLNEQAMVELVFGEGNLLRRWLGRWHLGKCARCRERYQELLREQESQRELAAQLREYGDCLQKAEETMTMPRPPVAGEREEEREA